MEAVQRGLEYIHSKVCYQLHPFIPDKKAAGIVAIKLLDCKLLDTLESGGVLVTAS